MNQYTSTQIDQLLNDSGLLSSKPKTQNFQNYDFSEDTILVTGAAGSIGSGISKQLTSCKYKKLILVDIAESPLYDLITDLEQKEANNIEFILLNISEKESIENLFETFKPTLVFHTAAYKHVPLMEDNPYEAVKLNFIATKLLADLSIKYKVKKFVFISTDKAVNPISVMGMTKRVAENYLNLLNTNDNTYFISTRFGNVFGSNGSVAPLFIKQIESGIPITITHKDITRYFICKHKACNLILKIATLNKLDSNLFTFNMGKPIKILDLAKKIIAHSRHNDESIKITGLRPGEKFEEEIISKNETIINTDYEDILLIKSKHNSKFTKPDFEILFNITPYSSLSEIKQILKRFI